MYEHIKEVIGPWLYKDGLLTDTDLVGYRYFVYEITFIQGDGTINKYIGKTTINPDRGFERYFGSGVNVEVIAFYSEHIDREVLALFQDEEEALEVEYELQKMYNVVEDPLYLNEMLGDMHYKFIMGPMARMRAVLNRKANLRPMIINEELIVPSNRDFANESGYDHSTISNWVAGRRKISDPHIKTIRYVNDTEWEFYLNQLNEENVE